MKGRLIIDVIAFGLLAAVLCGVMAGAVLLFLSGREPRWQVFSAVMSPDNTFVAENAMADTEDGIGRISVRRQTGSTIYEALFPETLPSLFLRWTDSSHLLVLSSSQSPLPAVNNLRTDGAVDVSYAAYVRLGAADASLKAKTHSALTLDPSSVTATFSEATHAGRPLKQCILGLVAKDSKKYSEIDFTITAGVFPCAVPSLRENLCLGVSSHFGIGGKLDRTPNEILTSATISEIPSYNELPDGTGYKAIRGQFLEKSANLLIEALQKPSFDIDYNFDFDQQNIRYTVPTRAISAPLGEFLKCVGPVAF